MRERRNHKRIELGIRIASRDNSTRGFTRDLSVGGFFIRKSEHIYLLPIGSKNSFYLEIPGEHV